MESHSSDFQFLNPNSCFQIVHWQAAGALLEKLGDNPQLFLVATACELYGEKVSGDNYEARYNDYDYDDDDAGNDFFVATACELYGEKVSLCRC